MKCLFVINDLARAGAEKQATLLACGLKALGWSVSIVVIKERNDFAEPLAAAAIPVRSLHRRGPLDLAVALRLRRAIQETSPDVVVSFLFLSNLLTVLAASSAETPSGDRGVRSLLVSRHPHGTSRGSWPGSPIKERI